MQADLTHLGRDDIIRRIPHDGQMCLLDEVVSWDDQKILCRAHTHTHLNHPLRIDGSLGSVNGVEYAAQAMAVHGVLIAERVPHGDEAKRAPLGGYLASMRDVTLHVSRLDINPGPLDVHAELLVSDGNTFLYRFAVQSSEKIFVEGRVIVVLNAAKTEVL